MDGPPSDNSLRDITRRHFFQECHVGLGKIALASLLCASNASAAPERGPLAPNPQPLPAKAKRVIYLFMAGAPSQLDLFDHKPALKRFDGTSVPEEIVKDQRYAFIRKDASLMASPFSFERHGESGAELSEMLPHLSEQVDKIAIVKSVFTDQFNHAPAQIFFNTGSPRLGRPSMGSWVTYGLGTEAEDMPGFVVLSSGAGVSGAAANGAPAEHPNARGGRARRPNPAPAASSRTPAPPQCGQQAP